MTNLLSLSQDDDDKAMIEKMLPVALSQEEQLAVARAASEDSRTLGLLRLEAKDSAREYKSRIEDAESHIAEQMDIVRSGKEWRKIACEVTFHRDRGEVTTTRMDTGELIETRAMTKEERQTAMRLT